MAKSFHPFQHTSTPMQSTSCETNNNNTSRERNMNRSGLGLPLVNQMAIPIYTVTREDVDVGGQVLLHEFIHQQFQSENLSDDDIVVHSPFPVDAAGDAGPQMYRAASPAMASTPEGFKNESMLHIGSNIRALADQFAASKERPLIKQQADQVDLGHINENSFFHLLNAIFKDGITRECIVALFFFCSDVLIRCVKQELREQGVKLLLWSMRYLKERVCRWVYENGGWERVFSNIYNVVFKASAIVALGIIISCGFVWMKKNL